MTTPKIFLMGLSSIVLVACDARVNVDNPPAEKESHTTVVNPPAEKKTETTVVAPGGASTTTETKH